MDDPVAPPPPVRAASALVTDGRGRVLLVRRGTAPNQGRWSLPGGKSWPGEDPAATARREVAEETGLMVRTGDELAVVPVVGGARAYRIQVVAAEVVGGTLAAGSDADAAEWFEPADIAALDTTDGLPEILARLGYALP